MKAEEISLAITDLMDEWNTPTNVRVGIIANVLVREGFATFPNERLPNQVTPLNIAATLIDLKKAYGETIGLALIQQGLAMLMWVENIEE